MSCLVQPPWENLVGRMELPCLDPAQDTRLKLLGKSTLEKWIWQLTKYFLYVEVSDIGFSFFYRLVFSGRGKRRYLEGAKILEWQQQYQETCGWLWSVRFSASISIGVWWTKSAFCLAHIGLFIWGTIHDCSWPYSKIHELWHLNQILMDKNEIFFSSPI